MTLGRTTEGAIKIKTDGNAGLRAVECGCCSCTGMFKQLEVDIQIPVIPGVTASVRGGNSFGVDLSVSISTLPMSPVAGSIGALDIVIRPDLMTMGQDTVYFGVYHPVCGSGYSTFLPQAIKVEITHPASVTYETTFECERDTGNGFEQYEKSASGLPPFDPCAPDYYWSENYTTATLTPQGSETSIMFLNPEYDLDRVTPQYMLIVNDAAEDLQAVWPPNNTALQGVLLKKLNTDGTEQTYSAYESTFFRRRPYQILDNFPVLSPSEGTLFYKKFTGFSSAPGNYELTWPLLKAPYNFTIPAL